MAMLAGGGAERASEAGAAAPAFRETHRIRIVNKAGGVVGVSLDAGRRYTDVGRVVRPAVESTTAFAAIGGVPPGTLAALGLDRWLIRVDEAASGTPPRVTGIAARGGGGDALAELDLPSASTLFTRLAPALGGRVFLQSGAALARMEAGYRPKAGDVWVIVAERPSRLPVEVLFDNKADGLVTAVQADGTVTPLGRVVKPVRGVGRYPGTAGAAPGGVAAQDPGAILVATPPAEDGSGAASAFRILSSAHADSGSRGAPSVLLVDPAAAAGLSLFALPIPPRGAGAETRVDMRRAGAAWEALPARSGGDSAAFVGEKGELVERFRLRLGEARPEALAAALRQIARPATAAAAPGNGPVYKGRLTVSANVTGRGIQMVKFFLDGQLRGIDNVPPYAWEWDTRTSPNGEHTIQIQGLDLQGRVINSTVSRVFVAN